MSLTQKAIRYHSTIPLQREMCGHMEITRLSDFSKNVQSINVIETLTDFPILQEATFLTG